MKQFKRFVCDLHLKIFMKCLISREGVIRICLILLRFLTIFSFLFLYFWRKHGEGCEKDVYLYRCFFAGDVYWVVRWLGIRTAIRFLCKRLASRKRGTQTLREREEKKVDLYDVRVNWFFVIKMFSTFLFNFLDIPEKKTTRFEDALPLNIAWFPIRS